MHKLISEFGYDLNIFGIRKAEGGARSTAYKSCFDENEDKCDNYRPLFWYKNSDKEDYARHYGIAYSKCYTEYGLKRTGCTGCPSRKSRWLANKQQKNYIPSKENVEENVLSEIIFEEYMSKLKERDKQIFSLFSEGYKQGEIGKIVGCSQSQVSRVGKKLCRYLKS